MDKITLLLFFLAAAFQRTSSIAIDNGVIGEPEVSCMPAGLSVHVATSQPFAGRIFVKGHSSVPRCTTAVPYVADASVAPMPGRPADAARYAAFALNYGECAVSRERQLNPRGVSYAAVVIVSFHPMFITKVDRAYRLQCFYAEAQKQLTASLDVSMIATTASVSGGPQMPDCSYSVHFDQLDGPVARFANVGDKVVHVWRCASVDNPADSDGSP